MQIHWPLPFEKCSVLCSYLSKVKNKKLYLATFASVLGPMSFGFVLGYSSPVIPELTAIADPRLQLDANQASWFGVRHRLQGLMVDSWCLGSEKCFVVQSIVTVGAAVGGLLGGWMVEKIGRKLSLMFCSLPFVFGFTVIVAAQNVWMLYAGRLLTGLASGVTSLVVPVRNAALTVALLCFLSVWGMLLLFIVFWISKREF